jgi:flagellar M-ring protein FliF
VSGLNILDWWKQLDPARRAFLGVGVGLIVLLTAAVAWFTLRTDYVPLFDTDATPGDTSSIVAQLDASGADYRVDADSKRLMVPADRRDKLRAVIEKQSGMLKQPKGFEVFDNADFGMTEFSQRINYERGLEGELARTIMGLDGVRYARLHLVLPDSSLFAQERDQPKASVTLMTAPGKTLSAQQIEGIRQLVAYAVPGLAPERVSIHDYRGVDLVTVTSPKDALSAAIDNRMKAKESIEEYLTTKIYEVLAPLYPAGSTAVSVDVSLRMDHVSSMRDETMPKLMAGASRGHGSAPREAPAPKPAEADAASGGTAAPAPPPPAPVVGDYGIDKLHQQIDELPGAVERITVGVLVPNGTAQRLSNDEVRQLIIGAIGVNEMRGDVVTVQATALPAAAASKTAEDSGSSDSAKPGSANSSHHTRSMPTGWIAGFAAAAVLLLLAGWLIGRQQRGTEPQLSAAEREALLGKVRQWLQQDGEGSAGAR